MLYTRSSIFERIMDENMNGNMAQPVGVLHVLGGTNLGVQRAGLWICTAI